MRRGPTISDVAARAGVSPTTVSHALSGRRSVSAATLAKVHQAIEELDYRPSAVARSLRTQRSEMIALIVPDIANPFYPAVTRGLHDAMAGEGYYTVVGNTDGRRDNEIGFLAEMVSRSVDGIVLFSWSVDDADLARVVPDGVPLVVCTYRQVGRHDRIISDDEGGGYSATRHVLDQGITEIAFVSGPDGKGAGDRRLAGYRRALAEAGLAPLADAVVRSEYTVVGGRDAMRSLLARSRPPRAVVCSNDLIAIGALDAAREAGADVPSDVAVVGFDDIDAAAMVVPALTTVRNPAYELGRRSGRLLLDRLTGGDDGPPREVLVPTQLVARTSA
ncbi:LacI family DNA-binding transcriptional regulator [Pseudonocardia sichuanensis]